MPKKPTIGENLVLLYGCATAYKREFPVVVAGNLLACGLREEALVGDVTGAALE